MTTANSSSPRRKKLSNLTRISCCLQLRTLLVSTQAAKSCHAHSEVVFWRSTSTTYHRRSSRQFYANAVASPRHMLNVLLLYFASYRSDDKPVACSRASKASPLSAISFVGQVETRSDIRSWLRTDTCFLQSVPAVRTTGLW